MKWNNTTSDGLPDISEPILLYANGVIQNAIYYRDAYDIDIDEVSFWRSDHIDIRNEEFDIKNTDRWIYVRDIPDPN